MPRTQWTDAGDCKNIKPPHEARHCCGTANAHLVVALTVVSSRASGSFFPLRGDWAVRVGQPVAEILLGGYLSGR